MYHQGVSLYVGLDVHKDSIDIATPPMPGTTAKCAIWARSPEAGKP